MATDAGARPTKGPLSGGSEQLTAYHVLECDTSERACAIAEQLLDFHVTAVEVREVHDHFETDTPATPPGVPSNTP